MEKLTVALVTIANCLQLYFQVHSIVVLTDQPLRQIISLPDTSGRLIMWSFKLENFDITIYKTRTIVKGQAVADFLIEFTY